MSKCGTPDVCHLKGCREARLQEISREHELEVKLTAERLALPPKIMIKRYPEPGVSAAGREGDIELIPDPYAGSYTELPNNAYEQAVIDAHSTPGLKKQALTRQGKKEQLNSQGMEKFPVDRDKILDQLYPKA